MKRRIWWVLFVDEWNQGTPTCRLFSNENEAKEVAEEITADFGGLKECPEAFGYEDVIL